MYAPEGDCVTLSTGIIVHVHTGSLAIKYIIEQDGHGRGIQPSDIFCNNDNDLGNVHATDVHTFVSVFHDGELVARVDGVTRQVDIGGMTRGHDQLASTTRYEDGLCATCEGDSAEFAAGTHEGGAGSGDQQATSKLSSITATTTATSSPCSIPFRERFSNSCRRRLRSASTACGR